MLNIDGQTGRGGIPELNHLQRLLQGGHPHAGRQYATIPLAARLQHKRRFKHVAVLRQAMVIKYGVATIASYPATVNRRVARCDTSEQCLPKNVSHHWARRLALGSGTLVNQVIDIDAAMDKIIYVWLDQHHESRRQLTKSIETHHGVENGKRLDFERLAASVLVLLKLPHHRLPEENRAERP